MARAAAVPAGRGATPWSAMRLSAVAGLVLLAALLLWHLADLIGYIVAALRYPYQLDYGEGIVWQQMRDIMGGTGYAPLHIYPAIVYHYPPVYHVASAALAAVAGMDPLYAGRLVSILSTFATAAMAACLAGRVLPDDDSRRVRLICGVLAGLLFLSCYPVRMWAPLMRVDMIAGLFGLVGMVMALRALSRPGWIYGAGLMFVLAMFAKQISVAAPAAVFAILLWTHPRLALRGIVFSAIVSLTALGAMMLLTDGGFLRHVVGHNVNRVDLSLLTGILLPQMAMHGAILALAGVGGAALWSPLRALLGAAGGVAAARQAMARDSRAIAIAMLLIFVVLKTIMLLGMMKSGSGYNYMIEWLSGVVVLAGAGLAPFVRRALGEVERAGPSLLSGLLLFLALPLQLVALHMGLPDHGVLPALEMERRPIVRSIAASARPVIADDMTFPIRAGQNVRYESAITAELGAKGVYDQAGFARLVQARCFGFFVIEGKLGESPARQRYNPVVADAIAIAYPRERVVGKYRLHYPTSPADTVACRSVIR